MGRFFCKLFQIIWGFSRGCVGHQKDRIGADTGDVKKIVSQVEKIGLAGVAMWNLNNGCQHQQGVTAEESNYFRALAALNPGWK